MKLRKENLEKLRELINEETIYRSGPVLVSFFNDLGFQDVYGQGFPSRWIFTDEKLSIINGTPKLNECILKVFSPVNFIGNIPKLDQHIKEFNQYLAFDDYKIVRTGKEIKIISDDQVELDESSIGSDEEEFLKKEFSEIELDDLQLEINVTEVLKQRLNEMEICLRSDAPLSLIFLAGSTLEGLLLGIALKNPKKFNQSNMSPKDDSDKVKEFHLWTLNNFINVAFDLGLLKEDVRKFSHALRDFRNYIHPYEQVSHGFNPDKHTAHICWQVLKAAIYQLSNKE
jgi:hypothetical protein